jgi:hypothetical protein
MQPSELQQIRSELLRLIQQQVTTLENLGFASATGAELRAFDARRERIHELGGKLSRAANESVTGCKASQEHGISPLRKNCGGSGSEPHPRRKDERAA